MGLWGPCVIAFSAAVVDVKDFRIESCLFQVRYKNFQVLIRAEK
jgi:hypothetical protein